MGLIPISSLKFLIPISSLKLIFENWKWILISSDNCTMIGLFVKIYKKILMVLTHYSLQKTSCKTKWI